MPDNCGGAGKPGGAGNPGLPPLPFEGSEKEAPSGLPPRHAPPRRTQPIRSKTSKKDKKEIMIMLIIMIIVMISCGLRAFSWPRCGPRESGPFAAPHADSGAVPFAPCCALALEVSAFIEHSKLHVGCETLNKETQRDCVDLAENFQTHIFL